MYCTWLPTIVRPPGRRGYLRAVNQVIPRKPGTVSLQQFYLASILEFIEKPVNLVSILHLLIVGEEGKCQHRLYLSGQKLFMEYHAIKCVYFPIPIFFPPSRSYHSTSDVCIGSLGLRSEFSLHTNPEQSTGHAQKVLS